ncbi:CbiQ family ECF transporter T component [Fodinicurvata halophila]|uniref:CbiQ family ECF transporter T component n=1 Tax=Fodinicurvata halophila TaxID=1419723 RepID=A0ABV8UIS7_9PROT
MVSLMIHRRWIRAMPAGAKLAALALISIALFLVQDPLILAVVLAATLALLAHLRALFLLRTLRPVGIMLLLAFAAHLFLGDWQLGLVVVLRVAVLVLLATIVTASTALSEMLVVLDRLLAPLRWAGLSTRPVSVAIVMTLRFVPLLAARWQGLSEAWRARSPRRPTWRLVTPFILTALDDADHAATALAARGAFARR